MAVCMRAPGGLSMFPKHCTKVLQASAHPTCTVGCQCKACNLPSNTNNSRLPTLGENEKLPKHQDFFENPEETLPHARSLGILLGTQSPGAAVQTPPGSLDSAESHQLHKYILNALTLGHREPGYHNILTCVRECRVALFTLSVSVAWIPAISCLFLHQEWFLELPQRADTAISGPLNPVVGLTLAQLCEVTAASGSNTKEHPAAPINSHVNGYDDQTIYTRGGGLGFEPSEGDLGAQGSRNKRRTRRDGDEEAPNGNGGRRGGRPQGQNGNDEGKKRFACPYYRIAPLAHVGCAKLSFDGVRHVKQHLTSSGTRRKHDHPHCDNCWDVFENAGQKAAHSRIACVRIPQTADFAKKALSEEDRQKIEDLPGDDEEVTWFRIWDIISKDHGFKRPRSPYLDDEEKRGVYLPAALELVGPDIPLIFTQAMGDLESFMSLFNARFLRAVVGDSQGRDPSDVRHRSYGAATNRSPQPPAQNLATMPGLGVNYPDASHLPGQRPRDNSLQFPQGIGASLNQHPVPNSGAFGASPNQNSILHPGPIYSYPSQPTFFLPFGSYRSPLVFPGPEANQQQPYGMPMPMQSALWPYQQLGQFSQPNWAASQNQANLGVGPAADWQPDLPPSPPIPGMATYNSGSQIPDHNLDNLQLWNSAVPGHDVDELHPLLPNMHGYM